MLKIISQILPELQMHEVYRGSYSILVWSQLLELTIFLCKNNL